MRIRFNRLCSYVHLCQDIRESAKQTYLGGTPPNMPPWVIRRADFHFSLSVSEFTFTVCVWIYITLVFWTSDIFGNPVPSWHLLLSSGVPAYIMVAYLVACHQDMSVLTLPLNPDIYRYVERSKSIRSDIIDDRGAIIQSYRRICLLKPKGMIRSLDISSQMFS